MNFTPPKNENSEIQSVELYVADELVDRQVRCPVCGVFVSESYVDMHEIHDEFQNLFRDSGTGFQTLSRLFPETGFQKHTM